MAKRYVMTAKRRAALRKAQLASARKRRKIGKSKVGRHVYKHRRKYGVGVGVLATGVAVKKGSAYGKFYRETKAFSSFDPESIRINADEKYTFRKHLASQRWIKKGARKNLFRQSRNIVMGRRINHPLMNGIEAIAAAHGMPILPQKRRVKLKRAYKNYRREIRDPYA